MMLKTTCTQPNPFPLCLQQPQHRRTLTIPLHPHLIPSPHPLPLPPPRSASTAAPSPPHPHLILTSFTLPSPTPPSASTAAPSPASAGRCRRWWSEACPRPSCHRRRSSITCCGSPSWTPSPREASDKWCGWDGWDLDGLRFGGLAVSEAGVGGRRGRCFIAAVDCCRGMRRDMLSRRVLNKYLAHRNTPRSSSTSTVAPSLIPSPPPSPLPQCATSTRSSPSSKRPCSRL